MKKATYFYLLRRGFLGGGGGFIPAVEDFKDRVLADSGTVEALRCLNDAIRGLPEADLGRVTFDAYSSRVTTDGGATEARNCTIDSINNLN